jgi:ABC-type iron transport system FetAB permease component
MGESESRIASKLNSIFKLVVIIMVFFIIIIAIFLVINRLDMKEDVKVILLAFLTVTGFTIILSTVILFGVVILDVQPNSANNNLKISDNEVDKSIIDHSSVSE